MWVVVIHEYLSKQFSRQLFLPFENSSVPTAFNSSIYCNICVHIITLPSSASWCHLPNIFKQQQKNEITLRLKFKYLWCCSFNRLPWFGCFSVGTDESGSFLNLFCTEACEVFSPQSAASSTSKTFRGKSRILIFLKRCYWLAFCHLSEISEYLQVFLRIRCPLSS